MPAIQLARLRQQVALVAEHFDDPTAFVRSLHYLLDFYADRARRPGQSGIPPTLLNAYKVPQPVLRLLLQELIPLAQQDPAKGINLCEALWDQEYFEFRLLAATILGQIPLDPPENVLKLIQSWIRRDLGNELITVLLRDGLARLRSGDPHSWFNLIEGWHMSPEPFYQQLGLRAIIPCLQEPQFDNLPILFRLIQPFVQNIPAGVRIDLLDLLTALARRSPVETAHFLSQTLELPDSTDTAWLIRQCLNEFPERVQKNLREKVRYR